MAKVLNLDELVPEERTLIHKGVSHVVGKVTLQDYLAFQKANEAFSKATSEADKMQYGLKAVRLVVPTLPEEEIGALYLPQLKALMEFINEAMGEMGSEASPNPTRPAGAETPAT